MKSRKPPSILDCARVVEYAEVDRFIEYQERNTLFVNGKLLGKVSNFAICQNINESDYLLFHCDRNWNVLGAVGHKTISEAKKKIERSYPGLKKKWNKSGVTKKAARIILDKKIGHMKCSFCGRLPVEVAARIVFSNKANICILCVDKFYESLHKV